jgi:hypothetical protein
MATLTDRPRQKSPAQPKPVKPRRRPQRPRRVTGPRRPPERNRQRDRILACLLLFGPAVAAILGALIAVAVVVALAVGGSSVEPPATGAAELVPGNALLYAHVSTDPTRPAVRQALALARRLPISPLLFAAVTTRLDAMLGGSGGAGVSYGADVRSWLGNEAALAVLDTSGSSAGSLLVLDVRAPAAARRFVASVGAHPDGAYRGVPLLAGSSGAVIAFIRHYLVLGQAGSVEAAIDVARGRTQALASSRGYQRAAGTEPAGRVLDVYASADGVRRALVPHSGLLGELGSLLDQPRLDAVSISISAAAGRLGIAVHSSLVPAPAKARVSRSVQFTPTLAGVLPVGSQLLLDARGLHSSVPRLLGIGARLGVGDRLGAVLSRLGSALAAQGVDPAQFLRLFSGETAIAVVPGVSGSGPVPVVITRTADEGEARAVLAGLQGPLTQVFAPPSNQPGLVPEVNDTTVAGVAVHELSLAPGFRLDYAVARGLVVLSTGPAGISGVYAHTRPLSSTRGFHSAVGGHPAEVTSLVFFDLSQLLRLGEQTGLIDSTRQASLWPAVEKIRDVGLESWRGANETTTELQLQIP